MIQLLDEDVLLILFPPPLRGIHDRQQQHAVAVVGVLEALRADQHRAMADLRELGRYFVIGDRRALRDDFLEEKAQILDVPLPVAKLIEGNPDCVVRLVSKVL